MMPDSTLIDFLTGRTRELIDVTSVESALKLVETYGGTAIWVPKNPKPEHALAQLLGLADFKKLCHYYGDTALEIDRCAGAIRALRNTKILEDSVTMTDRQIARKYKMTERHVRRIRSELPLPKDPRCLDIFEFFNEG